MHALCSGLGEVDSFLLKVFLVLVLVRCVFSWVGADPLNPIVRAVEALTEPMWGWLRRRLPFLCVGSWDLTPLAVYPICLFLDKAQLYLLGLLASRF